MTDYPGFAFDVTHTVTADPSWPGAARSGVLTTPHGTIETPAFIFCATRGAIRSSRNPRGPICPRRTSFDSVSFGRRPANARITGVRFFSRV